MKVLVIQPKIGMGDMVIYLPYIHAIAKKYNSSVSILVKENSRAKELLIDDKKISEVIILDRTKTNDGSHDGIKGFFKLVKELKKKKFDKVFIFNSSLRYFLISKFSGIKEVFHYPLFKKKNQQIIEAAKEFTLKSIGEDIESTPRLFLKEQDILKAKKDHSIDQSITNIILGIGGSGKTKRVPASIFKSFMSKVLKRSNCRFFLMTGNNIDELKIMDEIIESEYKEYCTPLNNFTIKEILPIIPNCQIAICNDSSFSHLSAGLGIKTIVLMVDTPLIYGSYNKNMYPILPEGETNVTHDTLGKDKINPEEIYSKFEKLLG